MAEASIEGIGGECPLVGVKFNYRDAIAAAEAEARDAETESDVYIVVQAQACLALASLHVLSRCMSVCCCCAPKTIGCFTSMCVYK